MFRILLVCVAMLAVICVSVSAAEPQSVTVWQITEPGYYTVSGSQIVAFPPGTPVRPPIIPPIIPSTKAAAIKAAAEAATADPQRATTAHNLAAMMSLMRSQVDAGTLANYQTITAAVNWMWDQVTAGRTGAWKPTKDLIGQHLASLAQEGARPEEYSGYFADAERALSGSLTAGERLATADDPLGINMETLMQLLEFFVKYILPLIIKI